MSLPEAHFLQTRDNGLQKSQEVTAVVDYLQQNSERIPNAADARISNYLGFLADEAAVNDGFLTGDRASIERQVNAACIDVTPATANAYFTFNAKIAAQDGIRLDPSSVRDDVKLADVARVQADQRQQLTEWATYVASPDASYADWFKHYTMTSVPKLTKFNEDTQKFEPRSNSSFALFPELDRESLSLTYDVLGKKIHKQPTGQYNPELLQALDTGSFARIYAEANKYGFAITPELRAITDGEWETYLQSPVQADADLLAGDVGKYRTGWYTAGKETAHTQLANGDFHVWFSQDRQGNETVPRVAIRMEQGAVREVRGIDKAQELEPVLIDTAMAKLKTLEGGSQYVKKAGDMKLLTALQKQLTAQPATPLGKADVKFLYEVGTTIEGFGYQSDPRIAELRTARGDQDQSILKEVAVEHVEQGFEASFAAQQIMASQLGELRGQPIPLGEQAARQDFAATIETWKQNGVLSYVGERMVTHGELHTVVMPPATTVTLTELKHLAVEFGKGQPYETYVYDSVYNACTPQELSGQLDNSTQQILLVPNKFSQVLGNRPVVEQRQALLTLQQENPSLGHHIPSPLAGVALWQTLRAEGDTLDNGDVWERTGIRHIEITPKRLGGSAVVPYSRVSGVGGPFLDYSYVSNGGGARVAVGKILPLKP